MKKVLPVLVFVLAVAAGFGVWWQFGGREAPQPAADTGNAAQKADLIRLATPQPNQTVSSPFTIKGEARGNWYFEASFPVMLTDWDGKIIAQGVAQAQSDWMTTDFVPFEATLTFVPDKNAYSNRGSLILKKDNPSGLPQNDDALEVPVVLAAAPAAGDYKNATYIIDNAPVTLAGGVAQTPAAPGSAAQVITRYFGNEATGDLNGDGVPDIAFILTQNTGGSGTFYYAVVALKTAGGYTGTNAILLGDRIAPQTTEIKDGRVVVNYAERKAGEPMTVQPSVGVSKYLRVQNGVLVEVAK